MTAWSYSVNFRCSGPFQGTISELAYRDSVKPQINLRMFVISCEDSIRTPLIRSAETESLDSSDSDGSVTLTLGDRGVWTACGLMIDTGERRCSEENLIATLSTSSPLVCCMDVSQSIFVPVAPTRSIEHPWSASFHFSFLILDSR
jgi:hypothetical protein